MSQHFQDPVEQYAGRDPNLSIYFSIRYELIISHCASCCISQSTDFLKSTIGLRQIAAAVSAEMGPSPRSLGWGTATHGLVLLTIYSHRQCGVVRRGLIYALRDTTLLPLKQLYKASTAAALSITKVFEIATRLILRVSGNNAPNAATA